MLLELCSAAEARKKFAKITEDKTPTVVLKNSTPVAVVVPYHIFKIMYEDHQEMKRARAIEKIKMLKDADNHEPSNKIYDNLADCFEELVE